MIGVESNVKEAKFFGWKVVAGCFCLMFFASAIISSTAALFMAPICAEFGFETAKYSMMNLIAALTGAVAAVYLAPKMQKGNMKKILLICTIITSITFFMMGFCKQLWQFFIVFGICNFTLGGLSQLPVSMLLTSWFNDKRSLAMSIAFTGTGFGGTIWSIVFGKLMATQGWQYCYFIGGMIVVIFTSLAIVFLIKKDPASCGQEIYTDKNKKVEKVDEDKEVWQGVDKKIAVKTPAFILLVIVVFLLGNLTAGVATHAINYLSSVGWEMSKAASVLSVFSFTNVIAYFVAGVIFDKLGIKTSTFIATIFAVIGLVGLSMAENQIFGYVYAVSFAFGMMTPRLLPSLMTSYAFGVKDYGAIYSYFNIAFLAGCALGAVITGVINDLFGYGVAWIVYIVAAILVYIFTHLAMSFSKKLKEEYPNT